MPNSTEDKPTSGVVVAAVKGAWKAISEDLVEIVKLPVQLFNNALIITAKHTPDITSISQDDFADLQAAQALVQSNPEAYQHARQEVASFIKTFETIYRAGLDVTTAMAVNSNAITIPTDDAIAIDIATAQAMLKRNPWMQQTMSAHGKILSHYLHQFQDAPLADKVELFSRLTVGAFLPSLLLRGTTAINHIHQYRKFRVWNPPLFSDTMEDVSYLFNNPHFKITINDIRNQHASSEFNYVITGKGELIIGKKAINITDLPEAERPWIKTETVRIPHNVLAKSADVVAAGQFIVKDCKIVKINNSSGHYLPFGDHLDTLVEHVFKKNGFYEASGKFVNFDGQCSFGTPIFARGITKPLTPTTTDAYLAAAIQYAATKPLSTEQTAALEPGHSPTRQMFSAPVEVSEASQPQPTTAQESLTEVAQYFIARQADSVETNPIQIEEIETTSAEPASVNFANLALQGHQCASIIGSIGNMLGARDAKMAEAIAHSAITITSNLAALAGVNSLLAYSNPLGAAAAILSSVSNIVDILNFQDPHEEVMRGINVLKQQLEELRNEIKAEFEIQRTLLLATQVNAQQTAETTHNQLQQIEHKIDQHHLEQKQEAETALNTLRKVESMLEQLQQNYLSDQQRKACSKIIEKIRLYHISEQSFPLTKKEINKFEKQLHALLEFNSKDVSVAGSLDLAAVKMQAGQSDFVINSLRMRALQASQTTTAHQQSLPNPMLWALLSTTLLTLYRHLYDLQPQAEENHITHDELAILEKSLQSGQQIQEFLIFIKNKNLFSELINNYQSALTQFQQSLQEKFLQYQQQVNIKFHQESTDAIKKQKDAEAKLFTEQAIDIATDYSSNWFAHHQHGRFGPNDHPTTNSYWGADAFRQQLAKERYTNSAKQHMLLAVQQHNVAVSRIAQKAAINFQTNLNLFSYANNVYNIDADAPTAPISFYILPENPQHPVLPAPLAIPSLGAELDALIARILRLNIGRLQQRYEIKDSRFIWKFYLVDHNDQPSFAPSQETCLAQFSLAYDKKFFRGGEAIWWDMVGGAVPTLNVQKSDHFQVCPGGKTVWEHYAMTPVFAQQQGRLQHIDQQQIVKLPTQVDIQNLKNKIIKKMDALAQGFHQFLINEFERDSALADQLTHIDTHYHWLRAMTELGFRDMQAYNLFASKFTVSTANAISVFTKAASTDAHLNLSKQLDETLRALNNFKTGILGQCDLHQGESYHSLLDAIVNLLQDNVARYRLSATAHNQYHPTAKADDCQAAVRAAQEDTQRIQDLSLNLLQAMADTLPPEQLQAVLAQFKQRTNLGVPAQLQFLAPPKAGLQQNQQITPPSLQP